MSRFACWNNGKRSWKKMILHPLFFSLVFQPLHSTYKKPSASLLDHLKLLLLSCFLMEVVELKVRLHCKACEKSVRKALCKLKGVTCVDIDATLNKITVLGYVERKAVVRAIRKTGRRAEAWASCREELGGFKTIFPRWGA